MEDSLRLKLHVRRSAESPDELLAVCAEVPSRAIEARHCHLVDCRGGPISHQVLTERERMVLGIMRDEVPVKEPGDFVPHPRCYVIPPRDSSGREVEMPPRMTVHLHAVGNQIGSCRVLLPLLLYSMIGHANADVALRAIGD